MSEATWADETASPVDAGKKDSSLGDAQTDGATEFRAGSTLHDTEFDVEVTLSELQGDVSNPLHSIQSFEQLGLYKPLPFANYERRY